MLSVTDYQFSSCIHHNSVQLFTCTIYGKPLHKFNHIFVNSMFGILYSLLFLCVLRHSGGLPFLIVLQ